MYPMPLNQQQPFTATASLNSGKKTRSNFFTLLPFAVLAQTDNSEALVRAVAEQVNQIEPEQERRELSTVVQLMAGLPYKKELIESIFREGKKLAR